MKRTWSLTLGILATMALLVCSPVQADLTPWFDNFEDPDDHSNWSIIGGSWPLGSVSFDGVQSVRWDFQNGARFERSIGSPIFPFEITLYYYHDGDGRNIKNRIMLHEGSAESGGRMMALKIEEHQSGPTFGIVSEDNAGGLSPLPDEVWHKIHITVRPGDGYDWYVNDTFIGTRLGANVFPSYLILKRNDSAGVSSASVAYIDAVTVANVPNCGDPDEPGLSPADVTGPQGVPDCYVDLYDFGAMSTSWMGCTDPANPSCQGWYWE